jgi:hypothetical protein
MWAVLPDAREWPVRAMSGAEAWLHPVEKNAPARTVGWGLRDVQCLLAVLFTFGRYELGKAGI